MKKMSDSAQVRMNAAISNAPATEFAAFSRFDLEQAATYALRAGVAAIDERGYWRATLDQPRTADEEKRLLLAAELRRRGEAVPA